MDTAKAMQQGLARIAGNEREYLITEAALDLYAALKGILPLARKVAAQSHFPASSFPEIEAAVAAIRKAETGEVRQPAPAEMSDPLEGQIDKLQAVFQALQVFADRFEAWDRAGDDEVPVSLRGTTREDVVEAMREARYALAQCPRLPSP